MGRKPTGRTTKTIRIPLKYERQLKSFLDCLKNGEFIELEPMPERVVKRILSIDCLHDAAWFSVCEALAEWKQTAVATYGEKQAKLLIADKYGDELCRRLFIWFGRAKEEKGTKRNEAQEASQQQYHPFSDRLLGKIRKSVKPWWVVLGVSSSADYAEVKMAHRELVKNWHPDFNPGNEDAIARTMEVNAAWREYKNSR